jgi:hypothetical protein
MKSEEALQGASNLDSTADDGGDDARISTAVQLSNEAKASGSASVALSAPARQPRDASPDLLGVAPHEERQPLVLLELQIGQLGHEHPSI